MHLGIGFSPRQGLSVSIAALLGAGAFPPVGLWPLALLSPALFIWLIRDQNATQARPVGILYGLIYGLGTMYWFFGLWGFGAIFLVGIMAGYFGLLATLIGMTREQRPMVRAALIALFAVGVEWLRGDAWYLRFPWYTAPHALAQSPAWIAPVHWLGVYGFSYIIWLIAACAVLQRSWIWLTSLLFPLTSFLLPAVEPPDREALLVQFEDPADASAIMRTFPAGKADLVVFPEYAFPLSLEGVLNSRSGPTLVARKLRSLVIFGTVLGEYGEPGFQNVAAVIDEEGRLLETFPKQHPVPLMIDGVPGTRRPVVKLSEGTLGVAICYDFDAPEISAGLIRSGATVLVAPTFDAMSWGHVQHVHHELLIRLRAVENDRWILRAASSGRTEAVNPHGVPSEAGIAIGEKGTVRVRYAHRSGVNLGGQMYVMGPIATGLTGLIALRYLARYLRGLRAARVKRRSVEDPSSPGRP